LARMGSSATPTVKTTYDARAVANYFLELAMPEGVPITPMAIQKLVYFAHGWMLAVYGRPLISQLIQAWDYGPVIVDLYREFKHFGDLPITQLAKDVHLRIQKYRDPAVADLLNQTWETYKHFTAIQLSNMTHVRGSPWSLAREKNQPFIDNDSIRTYFLALAK
jgi:uncharacterized phage-associated protein